MSAPTTITIDGTTYDLVPRVGQEAELEPKSRPGLDEVNFEDADCEALSFEEGLQRWSGHVLAHSSGSVALTPTQLRQLATWSLGAADHLEGVEPGSVDGIRPAADPVMSAYLTRHGAHTAAESRQVARKLLELAAAHDAEVTS